MIIWIDRPLANYHPDGRASCKLSSGWTGLLQMIIRMDRPLANDHPDGPASCKWSSRWTGLLQMIIWIGRPFANDHLNWPDFCKWSSRWTGLLQMILLFLLQIFSSPSSTINLLPYKRHVFRLQNYSSFFFPGFVLLWKSMFSFSKHILPFPSPLYFSSAKKNSFSKYHPPFPSLFIFSSTDAKLKIHES